MGSERCISLKAALLHFAVAFHPSEASFLNEFQFQCRSLPVAISDGERAKKGRRMCSSRYSAVRQACNLHRKEALEMTPPLFVSTVL